MLNNVFDHEDLDFDYSPVTTGVQLACLGILKEIHRVCIENDIQYSLGAGTVIGYKLFQGYIPWDDDIDLLMTRGEYLKFINIFPKKCKGKYKLIYYRGSETYNSLYAKVYDQETTIIENPNGQYLKHGVFIDISVLDGVPNKKFHTKAIRRGQLSYALLYRQCGLNANNRLKNFVLNIISHSPIYFWKDKIYREYENFCESGNRYNSKKCAELMVKNFWVSLYDVDIFENYILANFEGIETYIVRDYDRFLIQKYNKKDFLRNQPRDKRMPSHSVFFSNEIGYEDFNLYEYIAKNDKGSE